MWTEFKIRNWADMVDMPTPSTIIIPSHTFLKLRFEMGHKIIKGIADKRFPVVSPLTFSNRFPYTATHWMTNANPRIFGTIFTPVFPVVFPITLKIFCFLVVPAGIFANLFAIILVIFLGTFVVTFLATTSQSIFTSIFMIKIIRSCGEFIATFRTGFHHNYRGTSRSVQWIGLSDVHASP